MATVAIDIEQWDNDFLAAWQTRDIEKILTFYTDDCIVEDVVAGKVNHSKEELRAFLRDYYAGSPDLTFEKKFFAGSDNRFCTEWTMSGTHSGDWSFLRATGKRFSIQGVSLIELRNGKVKHQSDYYDGTSLMRQLGPPPSASAQEVISTTMNFEKRIAERKGKVRRIVTGHRDGKSVVLDDSEIPAQPLLGFELNELWGTTRIPTIPVEEADYRKQLELWRGEPLPDSGAVRVRLGLLPPDEEFFRYAKEKGADPAEDWRKAFGDDFRMHTTDTVDVGIILSGELCMELDDGVEVLLKPGDVVVNCGTRHGWRNRNVQNCLAAFVCVGAKRQTAEEADVAAVARRWIELYNDGTPTFYGSDRVLALYAEDCVWTESPTKMYPQGRKGSLPQLRSALAAGQAALVNRHVVLQELVSNGPVGAMRYTFSAIVSKDVPGYSKGNCISLEIAAFFKVRQGRIAEIHELIVELT